MDVLWADECQGKSRAHSGLLYVVIRNTSGEAKISSSAWELGVNIPISVCVSDGNTTGNGDNDYLYPTQSPAGWAELGTSTIWPQFQIIKSKLSVWYSHRPRPFLSFLFPNIRPRFGVFFSCIINSVLVMLMVMG